MGNATNTFLSSCSKIDFGIIDISGQKKCFYQKFNAQIISLCDTLPESVQTDALLFFMNYSGLSIGQELTFFKNYYTPSWSIVFWLTRFFPDNNRSFREKTKAAITAHSMAMILHSLDDHINDGELRASHLTLLLRSQAWMMMIDSLKSLSGGANNSKRIISDFIDDYYSGILASDDPETLDNYCTLFKKQMATWLIVPVLLSKIINKDDSFSNDVQAAFESFGIAWRLLDDINDIHLDMKNGTHSAVYICLPGEAKKLWDQNKKNGLSAEDASHDTILNHIINTRLIEKIHKKICRELQSAVLISEKINLVGLADELRCLLSPLKDRQILI